eukprot:8577956-Pyramimonas_sp.AAC.1
MARGVGGTRGSMTEVFKWREGWGGRAKDESRMSPFGTSALLRPVEPGPKGPRALPKSLRLRLKA